MRVSRVGPATHHRDAALGDDRLCRPAADGAAAASDDKCYGVVSSPFRGAGPNSPLPSSFILEGRVSRFGVEEYLGRNRVLCFSAYLVAHRFLYRCPHTYTPGAKSYRTEETGLCGRLGEWDLQRDARPHGNNGIDVPVVHVQRYTHTSKGCP